MALRGKTRQSAWMIAAAQVSILLSGPVVPAEVRTYQGDVSDVHVIRHVTQHPYAWRIWQPFIIQGDRKRDLIVAFGAMVNGKKDMGDILSATRQGVIPLDSVS